MFRNLFSNIPPVVKNLLILNILIWFAMNIVPALDQDTHQIYGTVLFQFTGIPAASALYVHVPAWQLHALVL